MNDDHSTNRLRRTILKAGAGASLTGLASGGVFAGRIGQAGKGRSQGRIHSADRLRVGGHGVGAGHRQEIRHQDRPVQGSVLGRRARQAGQWRTRRRARAVRPDLRRAPRRGRPEEGHGRADDPQQQRPGHHAVEEAGRQGRGRRRVAGQADEDREARIHLRPDLPDRHPRDVAVLLAGRQRHRPDEGRQDHHRAAAADGGQHAGREHGRLLRRRAVGPPRHRRRHRHHRRHHPGHLARPSGESAGHQRRMGQEIPEHRARADRGHAGSQQVDRRRRCRTRTRWPKPSPTSPTSTPRST